MQPPIAMIRLLPFALEELSSKAGMDQLHVSQIHDLSLFEKFLGFCAGRIGQILNVSSLANDAGISHVAASQRITILEAGYIVYRLKPYYAK